MIPEEARLTPRELREVARTTIAYWLMTNIEQGCGFKDMPFGKAAEEILTKAAPIIEKAERERIIGWLEGDCPHYHIERDVPRYRCALCWQALKEGKV